VLDESRIDSLARQHGNIAEGHSVQFHVYSRLMGQDISELDKHLDDHLAQDNFFGKSSPSTIVVVLTSHRPLSKPIY
jgi:hypothetical protein